MNPEDLKRRIDEIVIQLRDTYQLKSSAVYSFKMPSKMLLQYCIGTKQPLTPVVGQKWLSTFQHLQQGDPKEQRRYRSYQRCVGLLLDQQWQKQPIWKSYRYKSKRTLHSFQDVDYVTSYLRLLQEEGKAESTRSLSNRVIVSFTEYLQHISCLSYQALTPCIVKQFFFQDAFANRKPRGLQTYAYRLRLFLRYLVDQNVLPPHLPLAVPTSCPRITEIISCLSQKEVKQLLKMDQTPTAFKKRNYAMILLALRLGLRSSDIVKLQFHHLHWKQETISLFQQKTSKHVELPLLPDVGNALAEYIFQERPKSTSSYVFLRSSAPFTPLTRNACYSATRYQLQQEKKDGKSFPQGFHILRRTQASQMLQEGCSPSLIASFLGHVSIASIDPYLSTDVRCLRSCSLSLENITTTPEHLP
jgi:site-specific recombinase XerD